MEVVVSFIVERNIIGRGLLKGRSFIAEKVAYKLNALKFLA